MMIFMFSFGCTSNDMDNKAYDYNITVYYGSGCPHCARTISLLDSVRSKYEFNIIKKDIYSNAFEREEATTLWNMYNVPKNMRGVPTTMIDDMMIIGEMPKDKWDIVLENCRVNKICPKGYYWAGVITDELFKDHVNITDHANISMSPASLNETNNPTQTNADEEITLGAVILGAMADSINPCTIVVFAMLLMTIFIQENKRKVLIAGMIFISVIYIMYLLMGLGILKAIESTGLQMIFYVVMLILTCIMTILEFNAYINYKPGMLSIEMPMFLRPYAKKVLSAATSYPSIALAAVFCSLFLLPCSSGPYLAILSLLAKSKTVGHITYLLIYNFVFVLPLIIITLIVGTGISTPEKVKDTRDKYIKHMHLIAGILMGLLAIILLTQLLKYIQI